MSNPTLPTSSHSSALPITSPVRQRARGGSPTVWVVLLGITIAHVCSLWQGATLTGYFHPADWVLGWGEMAVMCVLALANGLGWAHSREIISILIITNVIFLASKLGYTLFFIGTPARLHTELGTTMFWVSAVPILASSMRITPTAHVFSQALPYTILIFSGLFALTPAGRAADLDIWFGLLQLGISCLTIVLATNFLIGLRTAYHKTQTQNQALSRLAYYDDLTGLHNRTFLDQRLRDLCVNGNKLAVLFLDFDGFKAINDTLGHATGDLVLKEIARRLKDIEHVTSCIARVSGDEFVIVLSDRTEAEPFAQWVVSELAKPLTIEGHLLRLSVSLGISLYPDDARTAHDLLLRADQAMYAVKRSGKNGYRFYGGELPGTDERRQLLERELRHAQERGEFFLMLQPICDLQTGKPETVEALLRWRHPEMGLIRPDIFIPIAEEAGLIVSMGEWVLAAALSVAQVWRAEGFGDLKIAVNVSPLQLMQTHFVTSVMQQLQRFDLPPSVLELEVTEGVNMHQGGQVSDNLRQLRAYGISLSLDDFGTGFASLSRLNELPVDVVKIDKVFVSDLTGDVQPARAKYVRTLILAMVNVASSLGLKLIVEGVETQEQRRVLMALGCDNAQGYLFSRPITEAELRGRLWLDDWDVATKESDPGDAGPSASDPSVSDPSVSDPSVSDPSADPSNSDSARTLGEDVVDGDVRGGSGAVNPA